MFEFQFIYFIRERFVDTAPEKIFPLITAFDNKFLPSYADEITPNGVQKVIRIVGLNEFDNVSVLFSSETVNINILCRSTRPTNEELIEKLDFITTALRKIKPEVRAWRLASIVTLIRRTTNEFNTQMYNKFFKGENPEEFFEWNTRRAAKRQHGEETLNVISTVTRGPVMNAGNPNENFDAIVTQLDVNTVVEKSADRFSITTELSSQLLDIASDNVERLLG